MATRAASAAPIQRVLRESGIQDPLLLANRDLNSITTTLNPCYSGARKHCPLARFLQHVSLTRESLATPLHEESDKRVECGTSLAQNRDREQSTNLANREQFAVPRRPSQSCTPR